jgi:hypothetical protein
MITPNTIAIMNSTKKIKNKIRAIPDAVCAIPPNPSRPAIIATTRKTNAQYSNIHTPFLVSSKWSFGKMARVSQILSTTQ